MKRAIALITGGPGGAGDAQDPSRTIASERALNAAIVATDISHSSEEYLEIFDHFYAEDIEGTTDSMKEPVHGRAAVRARLAGFLIPLHVFAEIGGVSVSIQSSPIRGDVADETHSEWTLRLRGENGPGSVAAVSSSISGTSVVPSGSGATGGGGMLRIYPDCEVLQW